ncbi:MAG: ribonuclease Z [Bacteroidales bacterium]|nr:ribonuclease Z [Bacteroidales bacterium]
MEFKLTSLGTASALPNPKRYSSAHVISIRGHLFLIDCGEGCQIQMCRKGISITKIEGILISHIHGDHMFGIFGLLSTMALLGRTAPLAIAAPESFRVVMDFFNEHFAEGVKFDINFIPLTNKEPATIISHRSFIIQAFPLVHKIETYGYLFREKEPARNIRKWKIEADSLSLKEIAQLKNGENVTRENGEVLEVEDYTYIPFSPRSFAYCSDTMPFPELIPWIKGVSLLYHEATFGDDKEAKASEYFHSTARQAGRVAKEAGVGKLVIGHYSTRYPDLNVLLSQAKEEFPETYLSDDGLSFEIPIKRKTKN